MNSIKKCAVVIGVGKVGNLPLLLGAVPDAKQFADWAESQDFEVMLFTDETKPVLAGDILKGIDSFIRKDIYSQMIIYFAGHGILKGPDYELWLLSNAPDNANEAVNLVGSISLSRNSEIAHVVFISDACRSIPEDQLFMQMMGSSIFPNRPPGIQIPEVDIFYATRPGNTAHEVQTNIACKREGIFTKCLLKGLSGQNPKVLLLIPEIDKSKRFVLSRPLKEHLPSEVLRLAIDIDIRLNQNPEIRVESAVPKYLAKFDNPMNILLESAEEFHQEGNEILNLKEPEVKYEKPNNIPNSDGDDTYVASFIKNMSDLHTQNFMDDVGKIFDSKGRESFETTTGFTIIGEEIETVYFSEDTNYDIFPENGNTHVRIHANYNLKQSILIVLRNGNSIPLAILNGFIGTIIFNEGKVLTVNYTPSRNTPRYMEYEMFSNQIELRRALVATSARNGLDFTDDIRDAESLRKYKSFDPSLGLYASYAYAQGGKIKDILSVFRYMVEESEALMFDVALLAGQLNKTTHQISPFCPMLTKGWAYIDPFNTQIEPYIREASKYLIPELWTTFSYEGTNILTENMYNRRFA